MNYIYSKGGTGSVLTGVLDPALDPGETISGIVIGIVSPVTDTPVVVAITSMLATPIQFTVRGGDVNKTYSVPLTITTNLQTRRISLVVTVTDESFQPYESVSPMSYQDLLGSMPAGSSAIATMVFSAENNVDLAGARVEWELIDQDNVVYASGNAFSVTNQNSGFQTAIIAQSLINVPSDTPPTIDTPYQIKYTLSLSAFEMYAFEVLTVTGNAPAQLGTSDSVELVGDLATLSLVTDKAYSDVTVSIYLDNKVIGNQEIGNPTRIAGGYFWSGVIDTSGLPVSLSPYQVSWAYSNGQAAQKNRESAALWIVNPSILQAVDDVRSKINKARQTLYGTPDSQFPTQEILKWLRRGADAFNSAYGVFTNFDFTNAKSGIREFWLLQAELAAIESQYMMEAEKAFQFQGAAITLDVDKTQYLDTAATRIQTRLDAEFKAFKANLMAKGIMRGDGSADLSRASRGALAAVSILISPATPNYGLGGHLPIR